MPPSGEADGRTALEVAVRVRGLTGGGCQEQVRGSCRRANAPIPDERAAQFLKKINRVKQVAHSKHIIQCHD